MKLTRREVLHLGLLGAGAVALTGLVEVFGKPATSALTAPTLQGLLAARRQAGAAPGMDVITVGTDLVASASNDVVFFLQRGTARLFGSDTRVWVSPTVDPGARITPAGPFPAHWLPYAHPEHGLSVPQGLNAFDYTFSQPGLWTLVVETTSGSHAIGSTVITNDGKGIKAKGENKVRIPGDPAIASVTPTVSDAQGVNPICTRQPQCDMHQISLKDAIANGKPTAFIVATPKFCQSRNCGPSLDELIAVEAGVQGKVNFVHAEVYPNEDTATIEQMVTTPTFNAWGLVSEPWLFLIDRAGVIRSRFEGGFTAGQIRAALQPLLA